MQDAKQGVADLFDAKEWRVGFVVARFNQHITEQLYKSAVDRAHDYRIPDSKIDVIYVAGSVEIPLALQRLAHTGRYNVLLAIGCVIRGETPHFEYVCQIATNGVLEVQLKYDLPIGFGVLTCEDEAQAQARAHLGGEHLDAAMQLAKSLSVIQAS